MNPRVIVFGSTGLIGSNVLKSLRDHEFNAEGTSRSGKYSTSKLDITRREDLTDFLNSRHPEVIVNCAGVVGVNECNRAPYDSLEVNTSFVGNISRYCSDNGAKLVHLSTVAVFDGNKKTPYEEKDHPDFLQGNLYNITKATAEAIASLVPDNVIIRVGDTYGLSALPERTIGGSVFRYAFNQLKSGNVLGAFKGVITNQTLLQDIGSYVCSLIESGFSGKINLGGERVDIRQFFDMIKSTFNLPGEVIDAELPSNYQSNRALNLSTMEKEGFVVRPVAEGLGTLEDYLKAQN